MCGTNEHTKGGGHEVGEVVVGVSHIKLERQNARQGRATVRACGMFNKVIWVCRLAIGNCELTK